jgi:hypothetical protein
MANREGGPRGARGDDAGERITTADLEGVITRIPGVQAVRVVIGAGGRLTEVHVLATQERGAKQLVRDVQSSLLARFGIDVDYRIISIVQLHEERPPEPPQAPAAPATSEPPHEEPAQEPVPTPDLTEQPKSRGNRPALARIASESDGTTTSVSIDVTFDHATSSGSAKGAATIGSKLVAQATIEAVGKLLPQPSVVIDLAEVVSAQDHRVALVVLRLPDDRGDRIVSGSAIVRKDASDAIARATLNAVNRALKL